MRAARPPDAGRRAPRAAARPGPPVPTASRRGPSRLPSPGSPDRSRRPKPGAARVRPSRAQRRPRSGVAAAPIRGRLRCRAASARKIAPDGRRRIVRADQGRERPPPPDGARSRRHGRRSASRIRPDGAPRPAPAPRSRHQGRATALRAGRPAAPAPAASPPGAMPGRACCRDPTSAQGLAQMPRHGGPWYWWRRCPTSIRSSGRCCAGFLPKGRMT